MYLILHVTLQDHLIKGTVIVCKHRARYSGHGDCASEDIMLLIYRMTSHDDVIKRLCDFTGESFA